jgi:hypothetical protein
MNELRVQPCKLVTTLINPIKTTDDVNPDNKDIFVPEILKEAVIVWKNYNASKFELNLTETDFRLHLTMMKRLWNLAENFNASEKGCFPIL